MRAHRNNVGFLRLVLACLVIVGHAPEMIDGDRSREPLTVFLHSVSLGELAVDAFFLLSGYLITQSMLNSPSLSHYLKRRALRIYPGFVVAYLICVYLLGPAVGAAPWKLSGVTFFRLVTLQPPLNYPGQLPGFHNPALNGSMWTIAYEFRCYLLIALLGWLGLLARKGSILTLSIAGVISSILVTYTVFRQPLTELGRHWGMGTLIGDPPSAIRLTSIFLIGASFYLYRDTIFPRLNGGVALLFGVAAALLMYNDAHFGEAALATFGAMTLFWMAYKADVGPLRGLNDRWDVSYGVYLYGWPAAVLILCFAPTHSPTLLAICTLLVALAGGAASWWLIEKRCKDLVSSSRIRLANRRDAADTHYDAEAVS